MAASKKRVLKKCKPAPKKTPVEKEETVEEEGGEMDADELDLLFWDSPHQYYQPKYADS